MILDARYERVREAGRVVDCAVLVAIGVTASGHRRVLGVSVALSEAEVHWRAFLDSLIERGLRGVKFLASDDHAGLKAARKAMFPGVPWQRCQFHLQRNAQGYVSRLEQRTPVAIANHQHPKPNLGNLQKRSCFICRYLIWVHSSKILCTSARCIWLSAGGSDFSSASEL
ncbi:Mobile element protein [Polaromonas sp. CG9_12]|nr:Mobile element protein [Polaromonas sp. CG9_12]